MHLQTVQAAFAVSDSVQSSELSLRARGNLWS
jgi:hypothetical protein